MLAVKGPLLSALGGKQVSNDCVGVPVAQSMLAFQPTRGLGAILVRSQILRRGLKRQTHFTERDDRGHGVGARALGI